jgi:hypothetical protein
MLVNGTSSKVVLQAPSERFANGLVVVALVSSYGLEIVTSKLRDSSERMPW